MKRIITFLAICFLTVSAQYASEPSWTANFSSPVNWQRVTNLGYLIVNSQDGLFGIDPETGKTIWNINELGTLPEGSFSPITGTQFFKIEENLNQKIKVKIINPVDGKILFDSDREDVNTLLSYHVLPKSNQLLVVGLKGGSMSASLFMYNIENGEKVWDNDELFRLEVETGIKGGFGAFANKLASEVGSAANAAGLTAEPVELDENSLLVLHPNFVYRITSKDGQLTWKHPIASSNVSEVYFYEKTPEVIYVSTETEETMQSTSSSEPTIVYYNPIYAIKLENGKSVWAEPFKAKGKLNKIIIDDRGMIVCPRENKPKINLVDYATGEGKWGKKGKGIKIKGTLVSYDKLGDQYAITTGFDNAFTNAGEEYYLNVFDPNTGLMKFEKYAKLKGDLRKTELVDKGMLYVTSREVNILDLTNGENIFQKSVEASKPVDPSKYDPAKHGLPIDEKENMLYIYSSKVNILYAIDKKAATLKALTGKIEFEGKEEPSHVELVDDGILLSSDQNIMKLDMDGKQIYHSYFPAPKLPGLMRALHAANAVRAAYISAGAAMYSAAFADVAAQSDDAVTQEIAGGLSEGYGELTKQGAAVTAQSTEMVFKRFKASAQNPGFVFILTEPSKKRYFLYQVSKADGQMKEEIDLAKDKEPSYEVDQVYSYVYYRKGDNEIVCYQFK